MTNIKKTIEEFNKKFTEAEFLHGVPVPLPLKLKKDLEAFIIKALKAQEQEHQKKLEELESGINKLDEDIKYYSNKEYRANFRSEAVLLIKETFRTINKT